MQFGICIHLERYDKNRISVQSSGVQSSGVRGSGVRGSEFSPAAGHRSGQFDRERDFGLTESHTIIKKRISNTEYRISNVEVRNSIDFNFF